MNETQARLAGREELSRDTRDMTPAAGQHCRSKDIIEIQIAGGKNYWCPTSRRQKKR
jgi:hypothetical protein